MTTIVLLELQVAPQRLADFHDYYSEITPDTFAFDGCVGLELLTNQDKETDITIVERWASRQAYDAYLQWRTETGVMGRLAGMLTVPPSIRFFDPAN